MKYKITGSIKQPIKCALETPTKGGNIPNSVAINRTNKPNQEEKIKTIIVTKTITKIHNLL